MPTAERRKRGASKKAATDKAPKDQSAGETDQVDDSDQEPITNFQKPQPDESGHPDDTLAREDNVGNGKSQLRLAGQERRSNKQLEQIAADLDDLQTKRMKLQKKEQAKRDEGAKLMQELKLDQYELPDGMEAVLDVKSKFKVHTKKTKGDGDE